MTLAGKSLTRRVDSDPQTVGQAIQLGLKRVPAALIGGTFLAILLRVGVGLWQAPPIELRTDPSETKETKTKITQVQSAAQSPSAQAAADLTKKLKTPVQSFLSLIGWEPSQESIAGPAVQAAQSKAAEAKAKVEPKKDPPKPTAYEKSKRKNLDNLEAQTAYYQREAAVAFEMAKKNGLLSLVEDVASYMNKDPAKMLALLYFESSMGEQQTFKDKRKATSAMGVAQITEDTFFQHCGRYKKDLMDFLNSSAPKEAGRIGFLLGYLDYNTQNGKASLRGADFAIDMKTKPDDLRKKILDLRKGKLGDKISLFLSAHDIEVKRAYIKRMLATRGASKATLAAIDECGSEFIDRMSHNFGPDGAIDLLTAKETLQAEKVIGGEKAFKNEWYGVKVNSMIQYIAQAWSVMSAEMKWRRDAHHADVAKIAKAKQAQPPKPTKAAQAKSAKAAPTQG